MMITPASWNVFHPGLGTRSVLALGKAGVDVISYSDIQFGMNINLGFGVSSAVGTGSTGFVNNKLINVQNVYGTNYNDTILGSDQDNILGGGLGNNAMLGKGGIDTVSYAGIDFGMVVKLDESRANGSGVGGAVNDILMGIENVIGTSYNDTIIGSNDANVINGGQGRNQIAGKGGIDTVSYDDIGFAMNINLGQSVARGTGLGTAYVDDWLVGMENGVGTSYDDTIAGSTENNVLAGGLGSNQYMINQGGGVDTIVSSSVTDKIIFSSLSAPSSSSYKQFIFTQQGSDLWIKHLGTSDQVCVRNFFNIRGIDRVELDLGNGKKEYINASMSEINYINVGLSDIRKLVQAMSGMVSEVLSLGGSELTPAQIRTIDSCLGDVGALANMWHVPTKSP